MSKKIRILLLILAFGSLLGCAVQGYYNIYPRDFVTKSLNQFPLQDDSNISVIIIDPFPDFDLNVHAVNLTLGYYENRQMKILNPDQYQTFPIHKRLYLFNLPPNTYYILSVIPDLSEELQPVMLPESSDDPTDEEAMISAELTRKIDRVPVDIAENTYKQFPLIVQKNTFNLLGEFALKKFSWSEETELLFIKDLDQDTKINYFQQHVKPDCKWNKLVNANL